MGLGWGEPKISDLGGFPGGPLVKTTPSNAEGVGSVPGRGAKIPHMPCGQKHKSKQTNPEAIL